MKHTAATAFDLSGELALITGGGTGLGLAMAQCLVAAGSRVVIVGRRMDVLQKAQAKLGEKASCYSMDVTEIDTLEQTMEKITAETGPVSILINNAGHIVKKPITETENTEFVSLIDTHVTGAFALSKTVIPHMRTAGKGHILFTASMASIFGLSEVIGYAAAKSALLGMVKSMSVELSPAGIRVNAIAPGWIKSKLLERTVEADPARKERVLSRTPMGRFGEGEDIGWAAAYLCSPAASFITGVCLCVDGGISIGF